MAIINCPECNEKISSTVDHCIHCGVKITVCPECEKIFTTDQSVCPECGYTIRKKEPHQEEIFDEKTDTIKETVTQWKSEVLIGQLWNKSSIIILIEGLLSYVPFFLAFLELFNWSDVLNYSSVLKNVNGYIIASTIILWLVSICDGIYQKYIAHILFSSWIKNKKIDLPKIIRADFAQNLEKIVPEEWQQTAPFWDFALKSELYDKHFASKNKRYMLELALLALSTVKYLLLGYFLTKNVEVYMQGVFWYGSKFAFDFSIVENWWMLIGYAIISIFQHVYASTVNKQLEKQQIEWMNKTMPENTKKYEVYVKNVFSYVRKKAINSSRNFS